MCILIGTVKTCVHYNSNKKCSSDLQKIKILVRVLVQAALQRNDSHLQFYMLSRARKTLVREKLKEKYDSTAVFQIYLDIISTNFRPINLYQYK